MAEPWLEFQAPESEGPWSAFAPPAAKPPGLVGRLKQGLNSTLNYGRINLTDNPDEIAGYVADTERNRPAVTPAQQKMQEEIQPYAQQAKEAEGFVPNVAAYGKLAAKRAGQLVSNPSEFAGMVAENLPNSVPGIAAGLAGGAVGGMTPVPGGALIGGLVGGTAGGYQVEQGSSMHDQIVKEAQARGVPLTDEKALSAIIAEKYPEFLQASRLKGVGTAGTDAAINALTLGVAGAGERAIAKEAQGLAALAKTGGISATDYAAQVAALEAKNAARNTLWQKALRGTGVTLGEMGGESVSEGVGQKLAYGQIDPLDVVDEGLLAVGQGAATAGARKVISPILGIGEKGGAEAAIEQAKNTVPAPAIPDPSTGGTFTPDPNGGVLERGLSAMANARAEVDSGAARNIDTIDRGLDLVAPPTAPNTLQDSELPIVGQPDAAAATDDFNFKDTASGQNVSTDNLLWIDAQSAADMLLQQDDATQGEAIYSLAMRNEQHANDIINAMQYQRAQRHAVAQRTAAAADKSGAVIPDAVREVAETRPQIPDVKVPVETQNTKAAPEANNGPARRVDMALPPAVTQQQLADQEANRSTPRASEQLFTEDAPVSPAVQPTQGAADAVSNQTAETVPQQAKQQAQTVADSGAGEVRANDPPGNATPAKGELDTGTPGSKPVPVARPAALPNHPAAKILAKALPEAKDVQIHSTDSLSSEKESGATGRMSKWRGKTIERMARVFGNRKVVFFSSSSPAGSTTNGMTYGADGVLYINIDAGVDPIAVVGHEWRHALRYSNAAAHAAINQAATKLLDSPGRLLEFAKVYHGVELAQDDGGSKDTKDLMARIEAGEATDEDKARLAEEFSADMTGNLWRDPKALREVFDTILEQHPPSAARTIIKSIGDAILKLIDKLIISTPKGKYSEMGISRDELLGLKKEIQSAMADSFKQDVQRRLDKVRAGQGGELKFATARKPGSDIGHKRENESGRYVGAPDWVGNAVGQIAVLRKKLRGLAKDGEPGRFWYENSSKAILELVNGDKNEAEKLVQLIAIYSPSNAVPGNTTMAVRAYYQWKQGLPIRVGTGNNDSKANELLYEGKEWGGIKTNSFYQNLMQEIDPSKNDTGTATMDMWMALAFDYGMKVVDQGPKYRFMEREIQRLARELTWTPHQVQAAIWTGMKGRIDPIRGALTAAELDNGWHNAEVTAAWNAGEKVAFATRQAAYEKAKAAGKKVSPPVLKLAGIDTLNSDRKKDHYKLAHKMGMVHNLRREDVEASKYDFSDAIKERTAQMSWEATPGASTGVLPGIHDAPMSQQQEYLAAQRAAFTDDKGNDIIGKEIGIAMAKSVQGFSGWKGISSVGVQDGMVIPPNSQEGGLVQPVARNAIDLFAAVRGLVLAQEGVAWHYPIYTGSKNALNGVKFDIGRLLTEEESANLYKALSEELGHTFSPPIATQDGLGFRVLNFPDEKFALKDDFSDKADLLGQTGVQRKTKLQKSQLEKNKEFRDAVYRAVERQAWKELTVGNVSRFESDGNLVENDWSNGDGDYRERIREATEGFGARSWAGRSDIFEWIDRDLRPKAEAVNKEFADKYGWGKQQALFSPARSDAAGSPGTRSGPGQADVGALPGSVSGTGVHYSKQQRSTLDSSFFGTGLKGDELPRVTEATDPRLKHRIYFYLNTGKGIKPEAGVGIHAHQADLSNIYDATNDARDLVAKYAGKKNEFESALIDAGYDGYMTQSSGVAILLGERSQPVEYLGTNDRPDVAQAGTAEKSDFGKLQRSVVDNKSLPSGEMTGADWKRMMPKLMPEIDVSHLADDQKYYKDGLVKRPEVKRSTARAMPAWWNEPSTNAFAKGMTQGDVIQDALDRYVKSGALKKIGEQYEFYHATPNKTLTELRAGTLLEYNPEDAKFFARRDRGLGKRAVTAIRLQLYPEQLNPPSGTWFSLRDDTPIDGAAKFSPARAQTETPEFLKWFGDSKVVDAEGKPLVVYHSTNADWSEFDPMQTLSSFGFHAGTKEQAEAVRGTGGTKADVTAVRPSEGLNVMPVYLALQNPLRMEDKGTWYSHQMIEDLAQKGIKDESPLPENARDLAGYGAGHMSVAWDRASEARKRWDLAVKTRMKAWRAEHPDAGREAYDDEARVTGRNYVRDLLAKNGYDGIVYDNKFEGKGDSYIAFEPTQIKSATGNNGQFNAKNPDIRFSPPRFFSQLATSIDQIPKKMETMPAAQWRMWLNGNAPKLGIKKDEIVWSGIDDYLEMRGKDKVTKAEVQQFLSENGTKVNDVVLGSPKTAKLEDVLYFQDLTQAEWDAADETQRNEWREEYASQSSMNPLETKFGQYVVPGGENYRELLITLPGGESLKDATERRDTAWTRISERIDFPSDAHPLRQTAWAQENVPKLYAEWQDASRVANGKKTDGDANTFRSSHFDPPNILAHLRMDERTDAQGDKVLFLEELQSDWGQKGKKEGFAISPAEKASLISEKEILTARFKELGRGKNSKKAMEEQQQILRRTGEISELLRREDRPPAAPFVTDTKSWVALGLKRAIMYAVQNGMSKVAWANGEQNAAHYDLTKQISSIRVERGGTETNPLYGLNARNNDGQMIISKSMPAGELEDHIGKELAERAIKETAGEKTEVKYSGLDLKVGGEGMKAFYDEIVPSVARDVLKKLGGGKVETVKLDGIPGGAREAGDVLDRQENPNFKMLEQQGFRISPSMAEKVQTEGVPLFSPARTNTFSKEERRLQKDYKDGKLDQAGWKAGMTEATNKFIDDVSDRFVDRELAETILRNHGIAKDVSGSFVNLRKYVDLWKLAIDAGPDKQNFKVMLNGFVSAVSGEDAARFIRSQGPRRESVQTAKDFLSAIAQTLGYKVNPKLQGNTLEVKRSTPRGAITNQPINQSWQDPDNMDKWDTFVRTMADKMWDTKKVLAAIRAAGIAIKDTIDPYLQEVLYHGRAAKRVSDFADSELRPMLVEMGMRKIERQELEDYLWARHATERNAQIAKINPKMPDGGSGLTNQQAADILAGQTVTVGKTATDPGRDIKLTISKMPGYRSLAAKVDAITKETTDTLVRYGLETQDTVDSWRATYGKYVPLMRDMEADDNYAGAFNLGLGTGQGFSVRGSASKRALGSERGVIDILANVAMQRERAIVRGEKNRVAQSMYGLAITAPNPDFWLPLNPDANKDPAQVTAELVAFGLNPIDAANIANEPKQRYTDPNTGMVMERINPQLRSRGDVLAVRINGKDRYVMFSSNERAQKMVAGLKNMDVDQLGMVMQKMAVVTRWFAAINTQYNPVFGLTNGIRDLGTGMLNLTSTELKGRQAEVFKNAFSALRGVYADLRDHRAGRTPTSRWALEFEEFALEGGQTGYRDMFQTSRDRTEGLMQELKDATKGKTLLTFSEKRSPLFGWLSDYNTAIENAIRLSAYKAAKDKGMTKAQAASLAKNLTVNFNKKGLAATQLGAMYAFFNAAAQGTARIGQTLVKVDNGKFSLTGAGKKIVYGGMMAGVLQAAMFAAAGYDDEEPPQFIREKNFIIPDFVFGSGKYLSIPYPLGFHVIPNIGRVSAEFALGGFKNPGKRLVDMFSMIMDGFNPIGGSSGGVSQMLSPTVTDPLVALSENKDWTGKSIYKEDFNSMHPTAGWTRKKDTASDLSRWMAYGINYLTGGGKYEIGLLSPTPDQLDFLIGQGTGGVGRESLKAWQFGSTVATGENMPMYKVPIAGRFVGETTGQASETSKFYNNLKRIGEHKAALDEMQKAHDLSAMIEYRKDNPDAALVKQADKASTDISDLKRRKRELLENGASPEQIRMMEEMITTRVRSYNERLSARG